METYKIKQDIDLKELKKFGFKKRLGHTGYMRIIDKDEITKQCFVYVSEILNPSIEVLPRFIYICTPLSLSLVHNGNNWIIKDLIDAGLIDKEENENDR